MDTLNSLQAELSILVVERTWIEKQGYLQGCWVAQYKPGGSARTEKVYWQARSSQAMFDGKKAKHLKASEVSEYQAQIARGRRLRQLNRQIVALQRRNGTDL